MSRYSTFLPNWKSPNWIPNGLAVVFSFLTKRSKLYCYSSSTSSLAEDEFFSKTHSIVRCEGYEEVLNL